MDASSTLGVNIDVLDTGITAGPSTIMPLNDGVPIQVGADGSASNIQLEVSFGYFTYHMLTV
jgi:hypothetical protein